MVTAVLFDIGGVLLTSPFEAFARYEADRGLPAGFLRGLNATDSDRNAWACFERGEIGVAEFCRRFEAEARAAGHAVDATEVLGLLHGEPRPEMLEAVHRCAARLRTALLTNNVMPMDRSAGRLPAGLAEVVAAVDEVIESSVIGVRKPEPDFYRVACERLGIEPAEAVFLDDLGVNLKPARQLGMTTIKVEEPHEALAELEAVVGFSLR